MHINAGDDFTVNPLFSQTGPPAGESALLSRRPAVGEHAETQRVLPDQVIGIPKGLGKLSLKPNGNPAAPRSSDPSAQVPARQGAADLLMPPAATGAKRTEANTASGDSVQPVRQPGDDTRDSVLTPGDQAALIKSDTNAPEPLKFLSKRTGYIVGAQFLAGAVMAGAGLLIYKGTSKHEKEIAEKAMAKYEKQSQNATDKMAAALAGAPKQAEEQQAVLDERTAQYQAYADETKASNDAVETKIVTWGP